MTPLCWFVVFLVSTTVLASSILWAACAISGAHAEDETPMESKENKWTLSR